MATAMHTAKQGLLALLLIAMHAHSFALDTTCYSNSGAVIATSQSSAWQVDKAVFNEKINNEPAAIAYAHTQSEVQAIIKCARAAGMRAVPRGGGHGYEGYAVQNGSIVVDISNLTDFSTSSDSSSVTFGSGFRLGDLSLTMYLEANALLPAGTCPWVGSSGQILGGGTGMSVRTYGLACDQLLALQMVDYQGNVVLASKTQNQDLLWASCGGGGGNLGIVTSFTLKASSLDKVPVVTTAVITWSGYDSAAQVFDKAQKYFATADRRIDGQLLIGFGGTSMNIQWFGDEDSLNQELQSSGILSVAGYQINDMAQGSFINATLRWSAGSMSIPTNSIYDLNMTSVPQAAEKYFTASSSYNQEFMSTEGIQTMVNAISSLPSNEMAFVEHKFLRGAVNDVNATATAFYYRDSLYESQWFYSWLEGDQSAQANAWLSSTKAAMQPYLGAGAYINYPDPLLAATSEWPQAYYGGNLDAYRTVKTKYDPTNYFNNPLTVAPYGPGVAALIASPPTIAAAAVTPPTPAPAPAMPVQTPSVLPPAPSPQLPAFVAPSQSLPTQTAFVAPSQSLPIMPALPSPAVAPPTTAVAASVQAPSPSTTAFNTIAVAG